MQARTLGIGRIATIFLLGCSLQAPALAQPDDGVAAAARACQRVTELSARLACYDRAFPPVSEPGVPEVATTAAPDTGETAHAEAAPRPAPPAPPEQAPRWEAAKIVELESPDLRTTILHAEDGRVFVRQNATTVMQWPDTPFDVEVQTSFLRTSTYLKLPGRSSRVRVVLRD